MDPRRLVISTANAINRQLGVLAKIQEQAIGMARGNETRADIVTSAVWQQVSEILIDATMDYPKARIKIAEGLSRLKITIEQGS